LTSYQPTRACKFARAQLGHASFPHLSFFRAFVKKIRATKSISSLAHLSLTTLTFFPSSGFYQNIRFLGHFISPTGDIPWLNITGIINGRAELTPIYYSPLCDIDVYQDIMVESPAGDYDKFPRSHRSCPPGIQAGYAEISSPPIPLYPGITPEGRWEIRAEATTQDGRRIFCVEGEFDVTK